MVHIKRPEQPWEKQTLQSADHLRRQEAPKYGMASFMEILKGVKEQGDGRDFQPVLNDPKNIESAEIIQTIYDNFDQQYHGFGQQKFPPHC